MSALGSRTPLARLRHDLRTPLNALIGYAEVLEEELDADGGSPLRAMLRQVVASGHRLLGSMTQVLSEVEQEANGDIPEGLHVRLARVMAHEVDLLYGHLGQLRALGLAPDDVARLEQAAANLWALATGNRAATAPTPAPRTSPPETTSAPVQAQHRGRTLVVDDVLENRLVLSRRLQLMGHEVLVADGGAQALALLAREPVDVVLLDILMPEMDGLEVLVRIREAPATRHLPVIMLSAVDNDAVVVRCIELGADDFVPKPFDPTFLRARVGACLEKKRLRDAEDAARAEADRQRRRVEELLAVMFPREVLPELTQRGEVAPRRYEGVAVLFCDVVDFTRWCDGQQPEVVVSHLQRLVTIQEDLAERHGLQKVKTIGDAFMAAAGVFRHTRTPVLDCVRWGLDAIAAAREATGWELRVGVHVGPVVGGIVGRTQSLFDLWGDTVNTAARMEAHGVAGAVCLTREAWEALGGACTGEELEAADVKGKGRLERWRVTGEQA